MSLRKTIPLDRDLLANPNLFWNPIEIYEMKSIFYKISGKVIYYHFVCWWNQ